MLCVSACYSRDNRQTRLLWGLRSQVFKVCKDRDPITSLETCCRVWPTSLWRFFLISNSSSPCCRLCSLALVLLVVHLQEMPCFVFPMSTLQVVEDSNWFSPCLLEPSPSLSCIMQLLLLPHFSLVFQSTAGFVLETQWSERGLATVLLQNHGQKPEKHIKGDT